MAHAIGIKASSKYQRYYGIDASGSEVGIMELANEIST